MAQVQRVSCLSVDAFRQTYLARSPVIIGDVAINWRAMRWTVRSLRDHFRGVWIPVPMEDEEFNAFCEATDDPLLYQSKQARRLIAQKRSLWVISLEAYFDAIIRRQDRAVHLPYIMDVPLSRSILERYLHILDMNATDQCDVAVAALESLIADVYFPDYLSGVRDYRLWFAPGRRARGLIHADGYDNLNAQIYGRKRWILLPPGCDADPRHPEARVCTTSAGDILYIPMSWWHAAAALGMCININAWHRDSDLPLE